MVAEFDSETFDVSVAMLTRNAGPLLQRVLSALRNQRTDRRIEVVAVDSGSTDGTREALESYGARVVTIAPTDFNFGETRDLLYKNCRGEIVVNLSQDAVPAHGEWLENLIEPLSDKSIGASCGTSIPDGERDTRQFAWERNGYFYFTREMKGFAAKYGRGLSFSNSAIPRWVWERLRFDPIPLGEDFQFQKKLHEEGLRTEFIDDAAVLHHHSYDLRGLYGRCRNEGLALRMLGCPYRAHELVLDLLSLPKYAQWLRESRYGRLHDRAERLFPVVRPVAVFMGSRFGGSYKDYGPYAAKDTVSRA